MTSLAEHERFETKRLILRKVEMSDAQDILEYASDVNFAKNAGFKIVEDLEAMKLDIVNFFMKNRLTIYGIVEKTTQKLIGSIDLRVRGEGADFGWSIHPDYWGRGLMPEAVSCLRDFAFNQLKLQVLTASHFVGNRQSGRVMEKIGMKKLGQIYDDYAGESLLADYYALMREEYLNQV
ncbi:GNAT family N-acetyltransferase [Lactococcus protaetiae]|nr:GNAT family N-acetyltransferase [Lactococcus protaetiae]